MKLFENFSDFFLLKFDKTEIYEINREKQNIFPAYIFMNELYDRATYNNGELPISTLSNCRNVEIYHKPSFIYSGRKRQYFDAINAFTSCSGQYLHLFKINGLEYSVLIGPGYILDSSGKILAMVAVKNPSSFSFYEQVYNSTLKDVRKDNIILYIAHEFMINPVYKNIFKKFYTNFVIEEASIKGIEVIFNTQEKIENILYRKIIDINSSVSLEEISREYNIEELLKYDVEEDKERLAELIRSHEPVQEESSDENYVWQDASYIMPEESAHDEAIRRSRERMESYVTDIYTREDFRNEYTVDIDPASLSEDTSSTVVRSGEGMWEQMRTFESNLPLSMTPEELLEEINTVFPDELSSISDDEEELLPED